MSNTILCSHGNILRVVGRFYAREPLSTICMGGLSSSGLVTFRQQLSSLLIVSWHSITDPDFFPNALDVNKSPMMSLFKPPMRRGSPKESLVLAAKHMQSPVFWCQVWNKVLAQYSVVLSISLANDMMKHSTNTTSDYKKLQTDYEITRGVTRKVILFFRKLLIVSQKLLIFFERHCFPDSEC